MCCVATVLQQILQSSQLVLRTTIQITHDYGFVDWVESIRFYHCAITKPVVCACIVVEMGSHLERVPVQSHNSFLDQRSRKVIVWFHWNHFVRTLSSSARFKTSCLFFYCVHRTNNFPYIFQEVPLSEIESCAFAAFILGWVWKLVSSSRQRNEFKCGSVFHLYFGATIDFFTLASTIQSKVWCRFRKHEIQKMFCLFCATNDAFSVHSLLFNLYLFPLSSGKSFWFNYICVSCQERKKYPLLLSAFCYKMSQNIIIFTWTIWPA